MNNLNCVASETGQINFEYKVPPIKVPTEAEIKEFIEKAKICPRCGASKWIVGFHCRKCEEEIKLENKRDARRMWLEEREKETIEGRLKFIEEWIYNHGSNHPSREAVFR